jgi:hypothetical protein
MYQLSVVKATMKISFHMSHVFILFLLKANVYSNTYVTLFEKSEPPECNCGLRRIVKHFFDCKLLEDARKTNNVSGIHDLEADDYTKNRNVIEFFRTICALHCL